MSIKIEFLEWTKKTPLEYDVETVKEAVEKATEDGANLSGANLPTCWKSTKSCLKSMRSLIRNFLKAHTDRSTFSTKAAM